MSDWSGKPHEYGRAVLTRTVEAESVLDDGEVVTLREPAGAIVWVTDQWEDDETVLIEGRSIGQWYVTVDYLKVMS